MSAQNKMIHTDIYIYIYMLSGKMIKILSINDGILIQMIKLGICLFQTD